MTVEQWCAVCGGEIDRSVRSHRAVTCSQQCSDEWKRFTQRMRRHRYAGKCRDCGAATDGSGGYSKQPKRCQKCSREHQRLQAEWSEQAIIEAIRRWHSTYGRPPGAAEWRTNTNSAHRHPVVNHVQRKFGTWAEAIRRAGYEPNPPGRRSKS